MSHDSPGTSAAPVAPAAPRTRPDRIRPVYVLAGNRTPFGRSGGALRNATNHDMLTAALDGLVARTGLQGELLGEVSAGAVLKSGQDFNLTRDAVLSSRLHPRTPATDVQKACATGLEATGLVADRIALGQIDAGISGGTDSSSTAPIEHSPGAQELLHRLSRAKTLKDRIAVVAGLRPHHLVPAPPSADDARTGLSMGESQAITNLAWGVTREAQDELALASHQHLAASYEAGFHDDLVTGYQGLGRDETLRPGSSLEKLASLKPAFGQSLGNPTMTAGNSTPLSDGASALLLGTSDWAADHGLTPLSRIVDRVTAAVDYVHGDDGLLMAPVRALPVLLQRNGLGLEDIDRFEIHEAFAGTVLASLAAWEDGEFCREQLGLDGPLGTIDRQRLNVHGSSLAAGHPFAATGTRILAVLAKELARLGTVEGRPARGVVSVCAAGGQGVVALLEAA